RRRRAPPALAAIHPIRASRYVSTAVVLSPAPSPSSVFPTMKTSTFRRPAWNTFAPERFARTASRSLRYFSTAAFSSSPCHSRSAVGSLKKSARGEGPRPPGPVPSARPTPVNRPPSVSLMPHFVEFTYGTSGTHTVAVDLDRVGAVVAQRDEGGRIVEV